MVPIDAGVVPLLVALFTAMQGAPPPIAPSRGAPPAGAIGAAGAAPTSAMLDALTFAATFDRGLDAEVARGDGRLHHGPSWGPPRHGEPGLVPSGAVTRERRGALRGQALRFQRRTDELLFFHGAGNTPWRARDWSGTLSFWLCAEPQGELPDGFCDPVTVTSKDWNDAGLFCEFEKREMFRHFRMGAYADLAVWNATSKPWGELSFEEKSLAQVEAEDHFGGRWTHVAMAFERFNSGAADGVARLYLDGQLAATLSPRLQTWTWEEAAQRIVLGLNYVGWLDELAWFDRALTEGEIAALHALPGGLADLWRPRVAVGAAKVDVTPRFPIRLCGYASREKEATSAVQPLFARALAVGEGDDLALLLALDNTAVPQRMTDEVAVRLAERFGLQPERFTLSVTHTHAAPVLDGGIDCMFGRPIPADQWQRIEQYSRELVDRLEEAGAAAIAARAPALLSWSEGQVDFARNRRTAGGPVDRALPLLAVFREDGTLAATVQNYACHCTACDGSVNQHCGDWAGYASEGIEAAHGGAVALTVIGCGADANPADGPSGDLRVAQRHGASVAAEVARLLRGPLVPLLTDRARDGGAPQIALERLELPYAPFPTREQWAARVKAGGAVGFHAAQWLARLDRGEALPAALPYSVQAWQWGDDLVQLFLPGEVVVDYALRLKRELDRARLWVTAYSNDVPCYIPSERILREGGYEAGGAMTYYGRPGPLAAGVEQRIVDAVHRLVPPAFAAPPDDPRFPTAKSAAESREQFELSRDDLAVELVACEPQVQSPVAIDFAADGTVYVCEMNDYPTGLDGNYQPGGRVTWLRDRDGDGRFEQSGVFVDGLPFPTGVMSWRRGALICAAPDILYAEDRDGDGRADVKQVLFTGFSTENYQARVNSLTWGLDGWIYGSCGLFGGVITGFAHDALGRASGAAPQALPPVDCRGRDFRLDPARGVIEAIEGTSQQGRVRDDFGRWFGCDSGWLVFEFPLADRVLRRNPFVVPLDPRSNVLADADPRQLFQVSTVLERFNEAGDASRVTGACGIGIYRDEWLGTELYGNAFTCEPVANVVRRTVLDTRGSAAIGRRAPEEASREFLASRDPWFRPVQATTGPDGALWIVDMYRFVIEHPRWIPAAKLAELDVRAGATMGRLWRVVKKGAERRNVADLANADVAQLREPLASRNGVVRDLAHRELLARVEPRAPRSVAESVTESIASGAPSGVEAIAGRMRATAPAAKVQEAWCFAQLGWLEEGDVSELLALNQLPEVRAACMPLAEEWLSRLTEESSAASWRGGSLAPPHPVTEWSVWTPADWKSLESDRGGEGGGRAPRRSFEPTGRERLQSALALSECATTSSGRLLGELLALHGDDPWLRAAVVSAAPRHAGALLEALLDARLAGATRSLAQQEALEAVVTTVGALPAEAQAVKRAALVPLLGEGDAASREPWRWRALARLLGPVSGGSGGSGGSGEPSGGGADLPASLAAQLERHRSAAREALQRADVGGGAEEADAEESDAEESDAAPVAALELLCSEATLSNSAALPLAELAAFVEPRHSAPLAGAALSALARRGDRGTAAELLPRLPRLLPERLGAALALLLSRPEWRHELLAALEAGTLSRALLDAAARERLLADDDAALRERAAKLLARGGTPKRAQVIAQFQPALSLAGDHAHGKALFAKLCASCHAFRGVGHEVGPDLAALGDRSAPRLLESLLDPNGAVNGEFVNYRVVLKDGSDLSGLIRGESSGGFTLVQANDQRRTLRRAEVAEVKASKLSLMPEGLEEGLSAQDLADLIAWLQSGPLRLGALSAESIAAARAELAAAPLNGYAQLLERFDDFAQPSWLGVVPMRYCRQQDGTQRVRWRSGPAEAVAGDPARVQLRFAVAMGLVSQPTAGFALAIDGVERLLFDAVVTDASWSAAAEAGELPIELAFECRAAHSEDATGVMTLTLPAERFPAGSTVELTVTGRAAPSLRWFGLLVP
ncbi:MAG: neutral/alkaline non-lysosomal ceramidase N-terminal domain-containing protein [Planctomycetes bacterium]|nr:neutral/alkaline non-lysosomal ceramidase N-terminal domain-containing protein [Planctomycetota bacterium]